MTMIGFNPYLMQSYGMQMGMAIGGSMSVQPQMGMPMMAGMGLQVSAPLGMGWAGFAGGLSGMAGMYGSMGMSGMYAGGMGMPGANAMGMVGMAGMGGVGMIDNTIEVAGKGMGKEFKNRMFPGELLAVHAVLKDGKSLSPEKMQTELKEKYGIDTEIKKVDGKQTLVNKATGNTVMTDGNGNNIMDMGDMKFDDALKQIKERYGMDPEMFAKMYDKNQGGMGATTGMNVPVMGGMGMMGGQGMNGMGMMGGGFGIWGDPMWQNSVFGIFGGAMQYAQMYGGRGF